MRAFISRTMLAVIVSLAAFQAQAGMITRTAEPDDFAAGTNISNVFTGVSLSAIISASSTASVFSATDSLASTGSRVFSTSPSFGGSWFQGVISFPALRADFTEFVTSVTIDIVGDNGSDFGTLEIFDSMGNSLGLATSGELTSPGQTETLSLSSGTGIAYAIMGGRDATGDNAHLDYLRWNVVPAPSTLLLMLGAVAGLGLTRRANS